MYDDGDHSAFLAQQIARIYERRLTRHLYPGDRGVEQPFLHLEDLTSAVQSFVEKPSDLAEHTVLLLGEKEVRGYGELQRLVGHLLHHEEWSTVSIPPKFARAGTWIQEAILDEDLFQKPWMVDIANDHYELDNSRAQETIGWSPSHSLR